MLGVLTLSRDYLAQVLGNSRKQESGSTVDLTVDIINLCKQLNLYAKYYK